MRTTNSSVPQLCFLLFAQSSIIRFSVELMFYLVSILAFFFFKSCRQQLKSVMLSYALSTFQEWYICLSLISNVLLFHMLIFPKDSGKLELSCSLDFKLPYISLVIWSDRGRIKIQTNLRRVWGSRWGTFWLHNNWVGWVLHRTGPRIQVRLSWYPLTPPKKMNLKKIPKLEGKR